MILVDPRKMRKWLVLLNELDILVVFLISSGNSGVRFLEFACEV